MADRLPARARPVRAPYARAGIREEALEAVADESQRLLAEGVVGDPADVDACCWSWRGLPLFLGGAVTGYGKIPV